MLIQPDDTRDPAVNFRQVETIQCFMAVAQVRQVEDLKDDRQVRRSGRSDGKVILQLF